MTAAVAKFTCNEAEARNLTDDIRKGVERVHQLLVRSYEWEAWRALGYVSWRDYAMSEFGMSKSRAYQLLDQARVIAAIESAGDSTMVESLTERHTRELAPIVAEHGAKAAAEVLALAAEQGKPTAAAIRKVAEDTGRRPTPPPIPPVVVNTETGEIVEDVVVVRVKVEDIAPTPVPATPEVAEFLADDAAIRTANLRHGFAKWLARANDIGTFDPTEMGAIDPELLESVERLTQRLDAFTAAYRASVQSNRRPRLVKEA